MFTTGVGIGWTGFIKITTNDHGGIAIPGILALIAAIASIIIKEIMYWYTRIAAKKVNSNALMAEAWHHRSDALSSIGSLVGIVGARLGFPLLDPMASIVICLFILKAAIEIFKDAIDKMTDKSCDDTVNDKIRKVILDQDSVLGVDELKTRLFGNKIYVDAEICINGSATLYESHIIAHRVHDAIEEEFPKVKHCMVHVNPVV